MTEPNIKQYCSYCSSGFCLFVILSIRLFNNLQTKTKVFWFIHRLFNSVTSISLIQFHQIGQGFVEFPRTRERNLQGPRVALATTSINSNADGSPLPPCRSGDYNRPAVRQEQNANQLCEMLKFSSSSMLISARRIIINCFSCGVAQKWTSNSFSVTLGVRMLTFEKLNAL